MRPLAAMAAAILLAACGAALAPTPGPPLPEPALKYRVMDAAGRVTFCDPDFYPVARADERELALQRLPDIQRDAAAYGAITARVGQDPLAVYREWKMLRALELQPVGDVFGFAYLARKTDTSSERVEGRVSADGRVTVLRREAAGPPVCPICLARGTRIATPSGDVAVELLRAGDVVWTLDHAGRRVPAPLLAVGMTPVTAHEVVRIALDDGRSVVASAGHPTADGRTVGTLVPGDALDGARVARATREPYRGGATFDVLPAGPTRIYWADGIALASTLATTR